MKIQDAHNSKTESALNRYARPLKEGSPGCSRDEDVWLFPSVFHRKAGGRRSNRVTGIAKLEEANEAGGSRSKDCTLVLTEGDSAKVVYAGASSGANGRVQVGSFFLANIWCLLLRRSVSRFRHWPFPGSRWWAATSGGYSRCEVNC